MDQVLPKRFTFPSLLLSSPGHCLWFSACDTEPRNSSAALLPLQWHPCLGRWQTDDNECGIILKLVYAALCGETVLECELCPLIQTQHKSVSTLPLTTSQLSFWGKILTFATRTLGISECRKTNGDFVISCADCPKSHLTATKIKMCQEISKGTEEMLMLICY